MLNARTPDPIVSPLRRIDFVTIVLAVTLTVIGIATIWGAMSSEGKPVPFRGYPRGQTIRLFISLVGMSVLALMNFRWSRRLAWPLYLGLLCVLGLLLIRGQAVKGAASWIFIPLGSSRFQLQPSEFGKIILVMVLAHYLSSRMHVFRRFHHTLVPGIIAAIPIALILIQPDFGTAVVYVPVTLVMFFVAGIRKRVLVAYAMLAVAAMAVGYPQLKPYQKGRIETFLNPGQDALGKGYNAIQAQTALGSGEIIGKGWGRGTQTSFRFLPEYQTDFVFPTFAEQFGFLGCLVVLVLFSLLVLRLVWIAANTEDLYGALMVSGFATVFVVHLTLNIGMATGLLPVTGLPLPFFSYGGSFMLTCYAMIGLSLSVGARRRPGDAN